MWHNSNREYKYRIFYRILYWIKKIEYKLENINFQIYIYIDTHTYDSPRKSQSSSFNKI